MTTATLPVCCEAGPQKTELCTRLARIAAEGPEAVHRRLDELAAEWTTGRLVKATTGLVLVAGLALATFVNPWWLILPGVAGLVLLQYLFFRRSWLAELFGQWGFRSGSEIEDERIALRVLRGDFRHLPTITQIEDKEAVSRMVGEGGPALDDDDDKYDPRDAANLIVLQGK